MSGSVPEKTAAEHVREVTARYGDHADAYVASRIEASHISGEDVLLWERVSRMLPAKEPIAD